MKKKYMPLKEYAPYKGYIHFKDSWGYSLYENKGMGHI